MFAEITRKAALRGRPNSLCFEYNVWDSLTAKNAGVQPDSESHIIQRNWTGQRVITNRDGWMRTTSGLYVNPETLLDPTRPEPKWAYEPYTLDKEIECRLLIEQTLRSIARRNVAPRVDRRILTEATELGALATLNQVSVPEERQQDGPRVAGSATLDLQVAAGADDAYEQINNTNFNGTGSWIQMMSQTGAIGSERGGHRFTGVTIQGVTVDVAYITVRTRSTSYDDPNVDIYMEDVDNSANFVDEADVTTRYNNVRTTAGVSWVATGIGVGAVNSPSLVAPVQEIADRATFADNAMTVLIAGKTDAFKFFHTFSYENDSTKALKLHIEYTAGGGGIPIAVAVYHQRYHNLAL